MSKIFILFFLLIVFSDAYNQNMSRQKALVFAADYLNTARQQYKKNAMADWNNKLLRYDSLLMRLDYTHFGNAPSGEKSLYISLHGGGNAPAKVNDQQWENQKKLYKPTEGLYIAPRAPTNTWNLWHEGHIDEMLGRIIKSAIVFEGVNPNKVYLLGYSAGGDGLFQLAPRMASHWAAASMMAGHPGDANALPLRNLPFAIFMGANDAAYDRNKHAITWGKMLDSLQDADKGAYIHNVHVYEGLGHWMNRKDTVAISWMAKFTRNPLPEKVVWIQDDRLHENFYWLGTENATTAAGNKAVVVINKAGNEITILENTFTQLLIYLNDEMLDLNRRVKIRVGEKIIFNKKVNRRESIIKKSIDQRLDQDVIFYGMVTVKNNREAAHQ